MKKFSLLFIIVFGVSTLALAGNGGPSKKSDYIMLKRDYLAYMAHLKKTGGTMAVSGKKQTKHVYNRRYAHKRMLRETPFTFLRPKLKKPVNSYRFNWN